MDIHVGLLVIIRSQKVQSFPGAMHPDPPNWHFALITHVDHSSSWCWTNQRLFNVHTIQKQLWWNSSIYKSKFDTHLTIMRSRMAMLRYTNSHPCWPGVLRLVECSVNFSSACITGNYHYIQDQIFMAMLSTYSYVLNRLGGAATPGLA